MEASRDMISELVFPNDFWGTFISIISFGRHHHNHKYYSFRSFKESCNSFLLNTPNFSISVSDYSSISLPMFVSVFPRMIQVPLSSLKGAVSWWPTPKNTIYISIKCNSEKIIGSKSLKKMSRITVAKIFQTTMFNKSQKPENKNHAVSKTSHLHPSVKQACF